MPFLTTKGMEEILEEMKVEPADKKLRRYKSNWLRHATRMNNNRMTKIVLNYRKSGRRRLGIPWKRLLDEAETGLSRSNWCEMMMNLLVRIHIEDFF